MQYTEAQQKVITDAGYKLGADGKIRDGGKMVSAAMAEQIVAGNMFANFNMEDLKKKKARKAATGTVDLVAELDKIAPAIGLLKVGGTARIPVPKGDVFRKGKGGVEKKLDPLRSFVQSIVTKVNSVTQKDHPWSGRVFDIVSDDSKEFLWIARKEDTDEPHTRKTSPGRNGSKVPSREEALAASRAHFGEGKPSTEEKDATEAVAEKGEAIQVGGDHEPEQIEEAQVVTH